MARSGGFGGGLPSLHPFGSLGSGFSQYDLGASSSTSTAADLAGMARYQTEVAWGNGTASDGEYLAALQGEIDATDPNTEKRITAENKLQDALYQIGRADAQRTGDPEALIAFDTASLGRMTPDNKRYQDIKATLDAELADRRTKQYGALVDSYNQGHATTQTLLDWVTATQEGLAGDAPDKANWQSTAVDLRERLQNEKDTQVFQDYQHQRIAPAAFLAYLTGRRDSYIAGSPSYQNWSNKLEDASQQVETQRLQAQDQTFFDAYNRGHKGDPTDADYLNYVRKRIQGMKADDPTRADWEHRLETATFSIAEDKLRIDVSENKRSASDLVAFYSHYRNTLEPNSPEWRTVTGKLDEAKSVVAGDTEARLKFQAGNPGVSVPQLPAGGAVDYGPTTNPSGHPTAAVGSIGHPPAGANFGGIRGGGYTSAELDYVANRMSQLTGLDPTVTRLWVLKEQGGGNNPLGVSGTGSAGHSGIRANFATIDEGINAAATWVNTHGNMRAIKNAAGKSIAEQIDAIDRSPWGPGGGRGGYNGSLLALAHGNLVAPKPSAGGPPARPGTTTPGPSDTGGTGGAHVTGPASGPPVQPNPAQQQLVDFYKSQLATMTPGSRDWETTYNKLQSAQDALAHAEPAVPTGNGKAISPRFTLETVVGALALSPNASDYQVNMFQTNRDSVATAYQRGDSVWLYQDPANPNAVTYARNPDGSFALDDAGKKVLVRGSSYLPVSGEALARISGIQADYYYQLSEHQRASGQYTDAAASLNKAQNVDDSIRQISNRVSKDRLEQVLNGNASHSGLVKVIDHAWATGDLATVVNVTGAALETISQLQTNPAVDDTRKGQFSDTATRLASNALLPDSSQGRVGAIDLEHSTYHRDASGHIVYDDIALLPGNHLVFKMDGGAKTFDVVNEGLAAPGEWDQTHVGVHVQFGDRVVTGEAKVDQSSPVSPMLSVSVDGQPRLLPMSANPTAIASATFFDGSGNRQTAYSLDRGQTWIRPNAGVLPVAKLTGDLSASRPDPSTGLITFSKQSADNYLSAPSGLLNQGTQTVLVTDHLGNVVQFGEGAQLGWYGQDQAVASVRANPFNDARVAAMVNRGATRAELIAGIGAAQGVPGLETSAQELGAPGQHMTLSFAGADGSINMLPATPARFWSDQFSRGVNDLLGKSAAQIAALKPLPGPGTFGTRPDPAFEGMAGLDGRSTNNRSSASSRGDFSVEARLAVDAQLPPGTPSRVGGSGLSSPPAVPVTPLPPVSATRTGPVFTEPTPQRSTVTLKPAAGPTFVTPPTTTYRPPPPLKVSAVGEKTAAPKPAAPVARPAPTTERTPVAPAPVKPAAPTPTPVRSAQRAV